MGEDITNRSRELSNPDFGIINDDGSITVHWATESERVDSDGFDKTVRFGNDRYYEEVVLPTGLILCRYGQPTGMFTAIVGTPYECLALPWKPESIPYMQYKVIADNLIVKLCVRKGIVAPMFSSKGGVIQFMHYHPIAVEVEDLRLLEEDWSWLKRKN